MHSVSLRLNLDRRLEALVEDNQSFSSLLEESNDAHLDDLVPWLLPELIMFGCYQLVVTLDILFERAGGLKIQDADNLMSQLSAERVAMLKFWHDASFGESFVLTQ